MRKKYCLFISFLLLFSMSCSNRIQKEEEIATIKIGITIYRSDDAFISSIVQNMEQIVEQFASNHAVLLNLAIEDAKRNPITQNKQIDNFIARDYDVICVNPVDRTMANFMINQTKKANIPIIFFNREPVESDMHLWERSYYVGADARESAHMFGQLICEAIENNPSLDKNKDGRLQYVMLEGEPTHQDALIRSEESLKTIAGNGIILDKLASATADWQRSNALAKMTSWLYEYDDQIEIVLSNNDDMALGAIDAMSQQEDMEFFPLVAGIDGTDDALRAIEQGTLYGTVLNDPYEQAYNILELAYWLALDEKPEDQMPNLSNRYIMIPQRILTKENVLNVLIERNKRASRIHPNEAMQ